LRTTLDPEASRSVGHGQVHVVLVDDEVGQPPSVTFR
jgi:hypothetical protein